MESGIDRRLPGNSLMIYLIRLPVNQLEEIYRSAGFFDQPDLPLPQALPARYRIWTGKIRYSATVQPL